MKAIPTVALSLMLVPPLFADAGQRLIPAGSLVSCTTGEARISSKNTAIGDPVLCKVSYRRGDFMLPYGSYLGGEFNEYKDPGHFVGKGYMELSLYRLYVGDTVMPIDAKVVDAPGYRIDYRGRILGKGHAVRDTITWLIPVLWPIDLLTLPRRGPRPTLRAETALTLRVMADFEVPVVPPPQREPDGLIPRGRNSHAPEPPPSIDNQQPRPELSYDQPAPEPAPEPAPVTVVYSEPVPVQYAPVPVAYVPVPVAYAPVLVAPPPMAYGGYLAGPRIAYMPYGRFYGPRPFVGYGASRYIAARPYGY